jgi:Ni,Fe-hydrogenase III large subunit
MAPGEPVIVASVHDLPPDGLEAWAGEVARRMDAGDRLVSLFGRPDGDDAVLTTAVLHSGSGSGTFALLRGRGRREAAFPSITARHPAAQMLERELWEQTGLVPVGHPWLKPVRYEGPRQQRMGGHPFFTVRGAEVHEVGVGPIHAGVIEPGHFRFMCHGERVLHLELQLGYQHRGIEALMLARPPLALTPLVETIAGDSSIACAWGYCAAVEALSGVDVGPAARLVRGIALELERIAMHLAALSGLATDIAFLQGGTSFGRLRTAVINATMRACGSRFGRGWLRPGGVRRGIAEPLRQDLLDTLAAFIEDMREVDDLMRGARSVRARLDGVGVVGRQAARDIGLVGFAARASGLSTDARVEHPGALYAAHPVECLVEEAGDCRARVSLRMREIGESVRWLQQALGGADGAAGALEADGPAGRPGAASTTSPASPASRWNDRLCVSLCEGVRGPVVQALETGPQGQLVHYKFQDPSLLNWFGLALAVRGHGISDFPVCNKSFDLSYCGNDL